MTVQDNSTPLILFVDDEATAVKYFRQAIGSLAPVATAGSVVEGKRILDENAQSLMVLVSDQRMPGGYGNELLHYAREKYPCMVRILTTAYSELEHTIEAVNQGQIHRYIQKPWEISALRVEMKQALGLATLCKEHAQLLREKMSVCQQQTLSNRIGTLYALCECFAGPESFSPLGTCLSAALAAGARPFEADWLKMDYADLVEAEARRSGRFWHEVDRRLAAVRQRHHSWQPAAGLAPLVDVLEGSAQPSGDGTMWFADARGFAEFLETASDAQVSSRYVSWLALLLWLCEKGCSLRMEKVEGGLRCRLEPAAPTSALRLAEWVGKFCNAGAALHGTD